MTDVEFVCLGGSSAFSVSLLNHVFTSVGLTDIYCICLVITQCDFTLLLRLCHWGLSGDPFPYPTDSHHGGFGLIFEHVLTFGPSQVLQADLCISCPVPRICQFSQEPRFLLLEVVLGSDWGARVLPADPTALPGLQLRERGCVCVPNIHQHSHR